MKYTCIFPRLFIISFCLLCTGLSQSHAKLNVLFLSVDDLKPVLGSYGFSDIQTPHMDRLAASGSIMLNNHCQQAVCAPSRMSMFSGLRPDETKVWDLRTHMTESNPDAITMQEHFKNNGYQTAGAGKTMHGSDPTHTNPASWTVPYTHDPNLPYADGFAVPAYGFYQGEHEQKVYQTMLDQGITHWKKQREYLTEQKAMPAVEKLDVPDDAYADGALATWAISQLEDFKTSGEPFFLTVGFKKPHLPFVAPKKYWDLYPQAEIPLAEFREKAENAPNIAFQNFGELRSYSDIEDSANIENPLDPEKQRELINGYYACVSYTDAQIGKILDKLEELELDENTIIVLWGDHGYHLGDHGMWNKHSNFEQATRSPLIITAPGFKGGQRVTGPTEFVDIFPTLLELAGLDAPYKMGGVSLVPALKDPAARVKEIAVSQYPRGKDIMGYALRNDRYRLVMWMRGGWKSSMPYNPGLLEAVELYDYQEDPLEKISQAENPVYAAVRAGLEKDLLAFFATQVTEAAIADVSTAVTPPLESTGPLVDLSTLDPATLEYRFASAKKSPQGDALVINFEHNPKWPSVDFFAPEGGWNLSMAGGIEVELTNHSSQNVKTVAYITHPDDTNANRKRYGEQVTLPAGKREKISIPFDGSIDASNLQTFRIFVNKTSGPVEMTLHGIQILEGDGQAAVPAANPAPKTEVKTISDAESWIDLQAVNAQNTRLRFTSLQAVEDGVQIDFELSPKWPSVDFMPPEGQLWDLSGNRSVQFTLTNTGKEKAKILGFFTNEGDTQKDQKRSTGFKKDLAPGESATAFLNLSAKENFDPAKITSMKIFTGMHKAPVQITVTDLKRN